MPYPSPVEHVPAMEVPPVLGNDEDVVEVQPPMTHSSDRLAWKPKLFLQPDYDGDSVAVCWPKLHIQKPIRIWWPCVGSNFKFENLFEFLCFCFCFYIKSSIGVVVWGASVWE
jgi:hypothetical protein